MKKLYLVILAMAILLGSIVISGPILLSWYTVKTISHVYVDCHESIQPYLMGVIGDGTNIAKKITDNYIILTSQKSERNEPIIVLQCLVNKENYKKEKKNTDNTKCDGTCYQDLIRSCVKLEENEPEDVFIPLNQMNKQRIVQQQGFFGRLGAKIFKKYLICRIDALFDFLGAGVPDKPKQYNAFIMCYESGLLSVHKFLVDENNEHPVLQGTHEIKLDERQATTIYMEIIVRMLISLLGEGKKPTNWNKYPQMDGDQDSIAQ